MPGKLIGDFTGERSSLSKITWLITGSLCYNPGHLTKKPSDQTRMSLHGSNSSLREICILLFSFFYGTKHFVPCERYLRS